MKALQVITPRSFTRVEVPVPELKTLAPDRILVRPHSVSMCGSDIPFFTGSKRHKSYPLPVGAPIHECAGTVVDSTSPQFRKGDWVVAIPENDQGLSEFFVGQSAKAVKLPPDTAGDGTLCLIQPLSTVMNAIDRLENPEGKTSAVVGLGAIGARTARLAKAMEMRVLGVRRNPHLPVAGVERIVGPDRLGELLPEADFVVMTAPLTHETQGMIGVSSPSRTRHSAVDACSFRAARCLVDAPT